MPGPPRGPPPRKKKSSDNLTKIPPPSTPPTKRGGAKSPSKSSLKSPDNEEGGGIPPPMVSGAPPRGGPPGKGKPKKRQSAALLFKMQQKEGGSTPKNRPTTPESKDNGEVVKSADWGVTPERERNKDKDDELSPRSNSPSPGKHSPQEHDDRRRSRKYSDADSYEDSYDSYRRGGGGSYDSDYEFEERGGRYTSSEDEGDGYRRRGSDSRYSDDASNSYDNDGNRYSPTSDNDSNGRGGRKRNGKSRRSKGKDKDKESPKGISPSAYFAGTFEGGVEEKEDCDDDDLDKKDKKTEAKAKGKTGSSNKPTKKESESKSDDDGDDKSVLPSTVDLFSKRLKFHEKGIKPEIFNGLHIPLILRELHAFLKAPVAGGLGTQVRCFIERDKSGVNKMAPVYTLFADHEDGSGRLLMCARKMWKSREPHYVISTNMDDLYRKREERSRHYMGKLRADASGSEYVLYDAGKSPKDLGLDEETKMSESGVLNDGTSSLRRELCVICYSPPSKKGKGARTMEVALPKVKGCEAEDGVEEWQPTSAKDSMPAHFARIRYQQSQNVLLAGRLFVAHLKESKYDPLSSCLVDFKERANCASVKNFQVVKSWPMDQTKKSVYHDEAHEGYGIPGNYDLPHPVLLQMGKVGKHCFNMDYQYPMSALQAFGICLSRFDTTL